jgi:hypothetical protein
MASGDDPLADYQNMLGLQGLTGPNPYLQYTGQIPMAGFYGAPTDASGKPIQSFTDTQNASNAWNAANPPPGTTLNTSTANPFAGVNIPPGQNTAVAQPFGGLNAQQWQALTPQQRSAAQGAMGQFQAGVAATPSDSFVASHNNPSGGSPGAGSYLQGLGYDAFNRMAGQPSASAAPAAPTNPYNMRQAYLDALSNPGKVTTPGAAMQPGATPTGAPQPSVLQAFLAAHPSGGTQIPGGYSNTGFFNTLNQLQAQKGAAT